MSLDFDSSYKFVFEETYRMWRSDLEKIFKIGTRGKNGGCNLSSCILVLIGIESFAHCFSSKKDHAEAVEKFVNEYYPSFYSGKMKKIYKLFRHGLAHNYYPKSEFNLVNTSRVAFGVDKETGRVFSLSRLRKDIENCRKSVLKFDPKPGNPYVVVPQVLFIDTVNVMESLRQRVITDAALQNNIVKNCERVKRNLGHIA